MKMGYERPYLEVKVYEFSDIITASGEISEGNSKTDEPTSSLDDLLGL